MTTFESERNKRADLRFILSHNLTNMSMNNIYQIRMVASVVYALSLRYEEISRNTAVNS